MASTVLPRDVPARSRHECPSIVALSRVPADGSVEYDTASRPALEFPGCDPVRLTWEEMQASDERLELWDAREETAWVLRDGPGPAHEAPGHTLPGLVELIAAVRGSPIKCYGAMQLLQRDRGGAPRRAMHPDHRTRRRARRRTRR